MKAYGSTMRVWGVGAVLASVVALMLAMSAGAPVRAQGAAPDPEDVKEGMTIYRTKADCQTCHGWAADGRKMDTQMPDAPSLRASRLVSGVSARMSSDELARRIGLAWERMPEPRHPFSLEIISPDRPSVFVNLGPHPPRLWPEDVDLLHDIWLKLSGREHLGHRLHHRDVVGLALRRLQKDMERGPDDIAAEAQRELRHD